MSTSKNKDTDEVNVRCLITNRQVGSIIGKKGERIQHIRDQCGVFLSILKPETRNVQERVLALRGTIPELAKALELISELILEGTSSKDKKSNDNLAICLLVQKFIVGSIIGKSGSMIQGIQSDTETKVQISSDPLPNSTEKTVTLTGTPTGIQQAAERILTQLKSFPLRAGTRAIRYKPGTRGMYDQQPQFGTAPFMATQQQQFYGMPPAYGSGAPPNQGNSTQKIAIPTVCAGSIIGRGGSVIRDMRARTGCSISIQDADNETPNERIAVLTGTAAGIQHAIFQIRTLVEQYRPPFQPPEY